MFQSKHTSAKNELKATEKVSKLTSLFGLSSMETNAGMPFRRRTSDLTWKAERKEINTIKTTPSEHQIRKRTNSVEHSKCDVSEGLHFQQRGLKNTQARFCHRTNICYVHASLSLSEWKFTRKPVVLTKTAIIIVII